MLLKNPEKKKRRGFNCITKRGYE